MQPFVLSALLSFAIYQLMAYSEILPRPAWFRIGGVRVDFSPTAATWAQRGLIVIITLLILIGILFVHESVSSFNSISRDKTNIVLGFLFGPLFAIWLNSVFNHPPGTPLTRGLVLGGIRTDRILHDRIGRQRGGQAARADRQADQRDQDPRWLRIIALQVGAQKRPKPGCAAACRQAQRQASSPTAALSASAMSANSTKSSSAIEIT